MKIIKYQNATKIRLKNKNIQVLSNSDTLLITCKVISEIENVNKQRAVHENLRNKAVSTTLLMSKESAIALYYALESELTL
jgi:rRNA-processing protein FCF1